MQHFALATWVAICTSQLREDYLREALLIILMFLSFTSPNGIIGESLESQSAVLGGSGYSLRFTLGSAPPNTKRSHASGCTTPRFCSSRIAHIEPVLSSLSAVLPPSE
jgi:hypothetical protein